jgi:hypothetical protein
MMPLLAAFLVTNIPFEEVKIPDNTIKILSVVDDRSFIIRLISSIRIKDISLIPPKINIKGETDF